jgi:molybdate transport system ATP-binding protein
VTGDLVAQVRNTSPFIDVDVTVPRGHTVAVMGPNGAGKTTLMNLLAGVERPTAGRVSLGDRELFGHRAFVPPHKRDVSMLTQQGLLFPHLTVRQNVAFGPASRRLPKAEIRVRTDKWLEAVGAVELADRKPAQLSGGQSQRVSLARALATEPSVLLLDEPFSALDVDVVHRVRSMLRGILADRARITVLVTHDVADAVTLADSAIILADGRVAAQGPVRELLASPVNQFSAQLAGLNLVGGVWNGQVLEAGGFAIAGLLDDPISLGSAAMAAFSPRAVALYRSPPSGSPRNAVKGIVMQLIPQGDVARVDARVADGSVVTATVTWSAVAELGLVADDEVFLVIKASEVTIYQSRL